MNFSMELARQQWSIAIAKKTEIRAGLTPPDREWGKHRSIVARRGVTIAQAWVILAMEPLRVRELLPTWLSLGEITGTGR